MDNEPRKVTVRFRPVGSTKAIKNSVVNVPASQHFKSLVGYLKRQLGADTPTLFCYVNASFAPSLDAKIGAIWDQYATDGVLNISYCHTVAFG